MPQVKRYDKQAKAKIDYLGGMSQRNLAVKYKVSRKSIENWSKAGNWEAERQISQTKAIIPEIVEHGIQAARQVDQQWRGRLDSIIAQQVDTSAKFADEINKIASNPNYISQVDMRELIALGKFVAETSKALASMQPVGASGHLPRPRQPTPGMSIEDEQRQLLEDLRAEGLD